MSAFEAAHGPAENLLVGGDGTPLEAFLAASTRCPPRDVSWWALAAEEAGEQLETGLADLRIIRERGPGQRFDRVFAAAVDCKIRDCNYMAT